MELVNEWQGGIRSVDKPGWWSVPPWETGASLCTLVAHFLRFQPWRDPSTAEQLAYFKGYAAAIETAPKHELTDPAAQQWYDDLWDCIERCVARFEEKLAGETRQGNRRLAPHPQRIL